MSIKKMSETTLTSTGTYSEMSVGAVGWGVASGGTEVTSDGYKYHTFTTSGTLTVTSTGKFEYLIVAGGGGGGSSSADAGGAGGVTSGETVLSTGSVTVTVGAGGAGGFGRAVFTSQTPAQGRQGFPSLLGEIFAVGGGGGGQTSWGGSGGGTDGLAFPNQGNIGGASAGGGAGAVSSGLVGGAGTSVFSQWGIATSTGENDGTGVRYYAGGGGGSAVTSRGVGGVGGGGDGGFTIGENDNFSPTAGLANTGGGGGAGFPGYEQRVIGGANGGSGLVIVRYEV